MAPREPRSVAPVLAALARGILGSIYTPEVVERMTETLSHVASDDDRNELLRTLRALDTKVGALALTGHPVRGSWLTASEAEAVIQRWKSSRIGKLRELASVLISLSMAAFYGYPNREWARIGYPGPPGPPPDVPKRIEPLPIESDTELKCDVVIVGSGAGGGCAAGILAQAGLDVIVLEKGGYSNESDFTQVEGEGFRNLYLYGGTLTTTDQGIRLFSGSTLGGGTVVNWTTSWKTPEPVLKEWALVSGIPAFASGELEESLDEVCRRLNVTLDSSASGKRDELLEEGLKRLGWHVDAMPRNVTSKCTQDEACGFCMYGCRTGAKQSSLVTYLEDAAKAGARVVVGADVRRVLIDDGHATGVEGYIGELNLTVRARAVIAACGSIETPALLLRSGLGGRVGHYMRLHPATTVAGVFDDEVRAWGGVMQARYSNQLDGPWTGGYGPTLETGPVHAAAWATVIPWTSAEEHHRLMSDFARTSVAGFPSRERGSGRVTIDKQGAPRVEYKITSDDELRIAEGVVAAAKVLEAAGARRIFTMHKQPIEYAPNGDAAHETWAEETRQRGYRDGQLMFFSMHQMGSCRMGIEPSTSAIDANNESHEVKDLYVMDASTFPTPSGVNPMISIYGIAHRAASKLAARLS
ncbi:MAG TPA: GMC family oxidoreductase [Actinomycetota bacterium]|nr:GMC family oxidoreductase [Actinomycetota bacterium]